MKRIPECHPENAHAARGVCQRCYHRNLYSDPFFRDVQEKRRIKRTYGLNQITYKKIVNDHGGRCAICGEEAKMNIDHDHSTGEVRGLLCKQCNTGLGMFRDNPMLMHRAVHYLGAN